MVTVQWLDRLHTGTRGINLLKLPQNILIAVCLVTAAASLRVAARADDVRFSRDVLPILSDRCFHCHGPDESNRQADLRLDIESGAKADPGDYGPISPGSLDDSELWTRITTDDTDLLMPPVDSHRKPLTTAEREIIEQWINDGAPWGRHWSLQPPTRPDVPPAADHPIDAFVQQRLGEHGLQPSPPAVPATRLRRLHLDLTGMSPPPEQVRDFAADPSAEAWSRAIGGLLDSPHHAERMAMWWLDAARYSDSDGFQLDETRENWPWRDWVIDAFGANMPFDQFTIEQFAGDLLPDATDEQVLATCFHRNHMTNGEGGRDPEESRMDYVIDRVNTTGTLWLGLTLGCAQCHTHKFDPIEHRDYYAMSAFFNSIDEDGRAGKKAEPYLKYQSSRVSPRIEAMERFIKKCRDAEAVAKTEAIGRFEQWLAEIIVDHPDQYKVWQYPPPTVTSAEGTEFAVGEDQIIQTQGPTPRQDDYRIEVPVPDGLNQISGWRLEIFADEQNVAGRYSRTGDGDFVLTNVRILRRGPGSPAESELPVQSAVADVEAPAEGKGKLASRYAKIADTLNDDARDGWTTRGEDSGRGDGSGANHVGVFQLEHPVPVGPDDRIVVELKHRSLAGDANIARFRIGLTHEVGETLTRVDGGSPIAELIDRHPTDVAEIGEELKNRLREQYLAADSIYQTILGRLETATRQLESLRQQSEPRDVMVLRQRQEPRESNILIRGVWDAKGETVAPAVLPAVLDGPSGDATRLDLAHWLVDRQNPLTARVIVNHLWQLMFGAGIVRTPDDFGLQGEFPTHPKLLDWLAVELMEHDWDLRHIIRLIATSDTYQQSSGVSEHLLEMDPENRWLARGARFRLPAWMIRDNALRVSGLLNPAIGGPPVYPYQPDGIWQEVTMGRFHYEPSLGPAQYRRTLYAYWRRSSSPTFLFDNAGRRVCEVMTRRTNTPLHALTLMNDATMLEAARALADQIIEPAEVTPEKQGFSSAVSQLSWRILSRDLESNEQEDLRQVYDAAIAYYDDNPDDAERLTTVGQAGPADRSVAAPVAAWMIVASTLMNTDEAITHE